MKQAGIFVSLFCLIILISSCGKDEKILARVGAEELRETDAFVLMEFLGYDPSKKDQLDFFIEEWTNRTLYKVELKEKYPEDWQLISMRADEFSSELCQFYLEELEFMKKVDTNVSQSDIQEYYDKHKEEFVLSDYLVKALYLKIPKQVDFKKAEIQEKYLLKKNKDLTEINSYAKLYAENFYFDDSSWVYFNELSEDIPLGKYNVDNIVLNRTKTYFSDADHWYFLNIIDYQLKDETPPVDFLSDQIKSIIVANRLQKVREKEAPKLLKRLKKNYEIEINP